MVELPEKQPVRWAKIRMPNGRLLTRPVSRLYPLEVSVAEEPPAAEDEDDFVPATETTPPHDIPPADETPFSSEQLAAERPASVPKHRYNLRPRVSKVTTAPTLLSALLLITFGSATAARAPAPPQQPDECRGCRVDCTAEGVRLLLTAPATKAEICCQGLNCFSESGTNSINLVLPPQLTAEPYFCDVRFWRGPTRLTPAVHVHCPSSNECPVQCWYCWDHLKKPMCITAGEWAVAVLVLLVVGWLLQKLRTAIAGLTWMFSTVWAMISCCRPRRRRRSRTPRVVHAQPTPLRKSKSATPLLSRWQYTVTIVVSSLLISSATCNLNVRSITATEEQCPRTKNGTVCTVTATTTLTLLPAGQEIELLLKGPTGENRGLVRLSARSLRTYCEPRTERFTRSYQTTTKSVLKCPKAGSCEDDYCARVRTDTVIEELAAWNDRPGNSYCTNGCEWLTCTCALPTSSCLFYRTLALPLNPTVYEVISCPTWDYRVQLSLKLETSHVNETAALELTPGFTTRWQNVSLLTFPAGQAPAPVLGREFVYDSGSDSMAMARDLNQDLVCENEGAASNFTCTLSPAACVSCLPAGENVTCNCRDQILEPMMADPRQTLPLDLRRYHLTHNKRNLYADLEHVPLQILLTLENMRLLPLVDQSQCVVQPLELRGCYDCDDGASFVFSCVTDFGETLAQIDCGTLVVHQRCDTKNQNYTRKVTLNVANVSMKCHVDCPAGGNSFLLIGHLRQLPHSIRNDYHTQQAKALSIGGITITVPQWAIDIKDTVTTVADLPYQVQLVGLGLLLFCMIYSFLRCHPMFRVWKKAYNALAIVAMATSVYGSPPGLQYSSGGTSALAVGIIVLLCFGIRYLWLQYWPQLQYPPVILVPSGKGPVSGRRGYVPRRISANQGNRSESSRLLPAATALRRPLKSRY